MSKLYTINKKTPWFLPPKKYPLSTTTISYLVARSVSFATSDFFRYIHRFQGGIPHIYKKQQKNNHPQHQCCCFCSQTFPPFQPQPTQRFQWGWFVCAGETASSGGVDGRHSENKLATKDLLIAQPIPHPRWLQVDNFQTNKKSIRFFLEWWINCWVIFTFER